MRSFLLLIGFIFVAQSLSAQNTPRFNQVNFAQGVNNPAALAIDGEIMVDMIFRNQWYGFEGAPTTGALNAQYELYHDMAVGLTASYDLIGVHHATQVSGQYAYRLYVNETNALIFGVSAGIDQRVHDLSSAQLTQSNDPAFSSPTSAREIEGVPVNEKTNTVINVAILLKIIIYTPYKFIYNFSY